MTSDDQVVRGIAIALQVGLQPRDRPARAVREIPRRGIDVLLRPALEAPKPVAEEGPPTPAQLGIEEVDGPRAHGDSRCERRYLVHGVTSFQGFRRPAGE